MTAGYDAFAPPSNLLHHRGSAGSLSLPELYDHQHAKHRLLKHARTPPVRSSLLLRNLRRAYVRRGSTAVTVTVTSTTTTRNTLAPPVSPRARLDSRRFTLAPLKLDDDDDNNNNEDDLELVGNCRRVVYFEPQVSIVEIPPRTAYSPEVAAMLWSSRRQIRNLAARNVIEYAFERKDWRNAIEEDRFYRYGQELVHPAHIVVMQQRGQLRLVKLQRLPSSSCKRRAGSVVATASVLSQFQPLHTGVGEAN